MKLNQVVALVKGTKARAVKKMEDVHRGWKTDLLKGIIRNYQPIDEDGERFPSENKPVVTTVSQVLEDMKVDVVRAIDVVHLQETGNMHARAKLGLGLDKELPVTVILYLEKVMTDLNTIVRNIPTLPQDREWQWADNKGCYVSDTEQTTKTQKKPQAIVKYEATKEHPAQTELVMTDITVGHWSTNHLSGAMPVEEKRVMLKRIQEIQDGLKIAREEANSIEVGNTPDIGAALMDYIFTKRF